MIFLGQFGLVFGARASFVFLADLTLSLKLPGMSHEVTSVMFKKGSVIYRETNEQKWGYPPIEHLAEDAAT